MPILRSKQEGSGNGSKTFIANIDEIAKALERDIKLIMKFFAFELGTLVKIGERNIINGHRQRSDIEDLLDLFIDRYVLCSKCQNPETIMTHNSLTCRACGHISKLPIDRITKLLEQSKRKIKKAKNKIDNLDESDDDDDWAVPTDPESVAKRRAMLFGNATIQADIPFGKNPIPYIVEFLEMNPSPLGEIY